MLNVFRAGSLSDGLIALSFWFSSVPPEKGSIPDEWGISVASRPIIFDPKTSTLLHVESPDDADLHEDEVEVRLSLLSKSVICYTIYIHHKIDGCLARCPRVRLSSKLQDSHVYVCKRAVIAAVQEKHLFESFREEFFPWLCKVQYQRGKQVKYGKG